MKEINVTIQPTAKGKYDSKSFWVARIKGLHPKYGIDREFIQKGDIAVIDLQGMYQISCDFQICYIIVEKDEYRVSNYNEINTILTMWG